MKQFIVLLLLLVQYNSYAQNNSYNEKPPVFSNCETVEIDALQKCFDKNIYARIYGNFKVPQKAINENYRGEVVVLFEVDTTGQFKVIYVDAMYEELKTEVKRVISIFPKVKPATYNGRPMYKQYSIPIKIPLVNQALVTKDLAKENEISKLEKTGGFSLYELF